MLSNERAGYDEKGKAGVDWLLWRLAPGTGAPDEAAPHELRSWIAILENRLARERSKGVARHWSYDLNRHIALKAARDRLRACLDRQAAQ